MKMLKENRLVEQIDADTCVKYWRMKLPMMSDRDNVVKMHSRALDDKNDFVLV